MQKYSLRHVHDDVLLRDLSALAAQDRCTTASLVAHIAEVKQRKLFRIAGQPHMHAYCVNVLKFSDDSAKRRLQAASAAGRYPRIFGALAEGRLHLTAVCLLAPHLLPENADELIIAAMDKTKFEIEKLIASKFPQADLPEVLQAVPLAVPSGFPGPIEGGPKSAPAHFFDSEAQASTSRPDREQGPEAALEQVVETAKPTITVPSNVAAPITAPQWPRVKPLSPQRYGLQVTLDEHTHDLLREAQALLAHSEGGREISHVLTRALDLLVRQLKQRRYAETDWPRHSSRKPKSVRTIPAAVKRAVKARDESRCTFENGNSERCPERSDLEYDHEKPIAQGGESTVENVRLRCRAHNQLDAERAYGTQFMQKKREQAKAQHAALANRPARKPREKTRTAEAISQESIHEKAYEAIPWLRQHAAQEPEAP